MPSVSLGTASSVGYHASCANADEHVLNKTAGTRPAATPERDGFVQSRGYTGTI